MNQKLRNLILLHLKDNVAEVQTTDAAGYFGSDPSLPSRAAASVSPEQRRQTVQRTRRSGAACLFQLCKAGPHPDCLRFQRAVFSSGIQLERR